MKNSEILLHSQPGMKYMKTIKIRKETYIGRI
jgi:hypothetical protein